MPKITHAQIDNTLRILITEQGSNTMLGRMGKKYGPYEVLISTILSTRAKDEVTEVISENLFEKYRDVYKLSKAKRNDVIKIIRKIGFYNAKSKNVIETSKIIVKEYNGKVPSNLKDLLSLPGVGRKVANCVLVYAYQIDAIPVDIHVHRISNRLGWISSKTPEESEDKLVKLVPRKHWQALNDSFVTHGKKTCTPISPKCSECPIYNNCKRVGVTRTR